MKNTLILQFKTTGGVTDYDRLIVLENALVQGYEQNHSGIVDGHDMGEGNMNIFIFPTKAWGPCIEIAIAYLRHKNMLEEAIIIKRLKSEKYKVVWPLDFSGEFVRL